MLRAEYPDLAPDPLPGGPADAWRRDWLPQRDGADGFFAVRLRRRKVRA
jgi:hypothetical protein